MSDDTAYTQLARLTTATGLYEHARGTTPRHEHGMCVDDVARALVVTTRAVAPSSDLRAMSRIYLGFLLDAQSPEGVMHNRRSPAGAWLDTPGTGDHWGRALWAFGVAATHSDDPQVVAGARLGAARAVHGRSEHPRAMAYAALGAALMLDVDRDDLATRRLLHAARTVLRAGVPHVLGDGPAAARQRTWLWPYERLTYANAVIPEAMIAIGGALHDSDLTTTGLTLLRWLQEEQTAGGHLSVVPADGRGPDGARPAFDQQPIEVTALAEAARTAHLATADPRWLDLLGLCRAWFEGENDCRLAVRDPETGGGYDGLENGSVNENQGAESTLAWLATRQLAAAGTRAVAAHA